MFINLINKQDPRAVGRSARGQGRGQLPSRATSRSPTPYIRFFEDLSFKNADAWIREWVVAAWSPNVSQSESPRRKTSAELGVFALVFFRPTIALALAGKILGLMNDIRAQKASISSLGTEGTSAGLVNRPDKTSTWRRPGSNSDEICPIWGPDEMSQIQDFLGQAS
ncbi:hypothetical protein R3P38DRAFT_2770926 [Favolaschia claudopus]|uniref:Uncharacterized protein n=1 Tax=Favolaschia claudopus TaxID=2862362 RepID=A0AAW0CDV1_9AGAR